MTRRRTVASYPLPEHRRRRRTVIVNISVPRELNYLIPSRIVEPRLRPQQRRYRHTRIPVVVRRRGLVKRSLMVTSSIYPSKLLPAVTQLRGDRLTHFSSAHVARYLAGEMNRRRYSERKSRRRAVSDGHLHSVRRDILLGSNTRDVRQLGDAALVQRAVFGD